MWPLTVVDRARCPTAARCATRGRWPAPSGRPSARPGPMSWSSRSVYGWIVWSRERGDRRLSPVRSSGRWHDAQPTRANELLARAPSSASPTSRRAGHGERARVEGHARRACASSISGSPPSVARRARGLAGGAVLLGKQRARDADVAVERAGVLLLDGRHVGLPAEAPERACCRSRRRATRLARPGDAVAVGVVGIGAGDDRRARAPPRAGRRRTPPARSRGEIMHVVGRAGRTPGRRSRSVGASSVYGVPSA